jgi:hypothetical protein
MSEVDRLAKVLRAVAEYQASSTALTNGILIYTEAIRAGGMLGKDEEEARARLHAQLDVYLDCAQAVRVSGRTEK